MPITRAALFVDQSNLDASFRRLRARLGWPPTIRLDYRSLATFLMLGSTAVHRAVYLPELENEGHDSFIRMLGASGYKIISKPPKVITNGDGEPQRKANFDVEIAVDAYRLACEGTFDEAVLISGDSDFSYLLDVLHGMSIRSAVVSTQESLASDLVQRADRVVLLEDILNLVTFKRSHGRARPGQRA